MAFCACHPQHLEAPGADMRLRRDYGSKHEISLTRHHIRQRRAGAFIRHVQDINASGGLKNLDRDMRVGVVAARGPVQLARVAPGIDQQFFHVGRRHPHIRNDDAGGRTDMHDRGEIGQRIGRTPPQQHVVDAGPRISQEQRIAIRRGIGHRLRADRATGTTAVVDDELLAQSFRELLREQTRHDVIRTPGRKRHDHAHWLVRVVLRRNGSRAQNAADQNQKQSPPTLFVHYLCRQQ